VELTPEQLDRARRGDRAARTLLVETYQQRVFAVCRALAGSDATDCAQDTFVKVLRYLDRYDVNRPVAFGAYVLRIARNVCLDRARSARISKYADADIDAMPGGGLPDLALAAEQRAARVRDAVLALPTDQRAAVALRMWGELEYEQIAEIEGVAIGTIRSRLSRARDALRDALEHRLDGGPRLDRPEEGNADAG
jgi:RNA polymerase sigma-70 factor (ECF subfamily)